VMTVVEVAYVGLATAIGRRQGWSVPTGIVHASPEEEEAEARDGDPEVPAPEIL